jgi:hypothetical protein
LIAARLHRAFENIAHAEILADRLGVDRLALEGHGRVVRDDEAAVNALLQKSGRFVSTLGFSLIFSAADSDEAARLKRDDCAHGFLDDAAPCNEIIPPGAPRVLA